MKIKPLLLLPALLLASACDSTPLSTALAVVVDVLAGNPGQLRIDYRVWNRGNNTVHLSACDRNVLVVTEQRVAGGTWQDVSPTTCPEGTASTAPIALAPAGSVYGGVTVPVRGEYRLGAVAVQPETGAVYRRVVSDSVRVR